jgi:Nuclease-related domain
MAEFRRRRREAMRNAWRDWAVLGLVLGAALVGVFVADGTLQIVAAWTAGFAMAVATAGWLMGGHVSSLPWMLGAAGEQQTAAQLARLSDTWHVVHDVQDGRGNWDHVAIGPPGVFLIDSKWFNGEARVEDDVLRSGRIRERGAKYRGQAVRLKEALERETAIAPWVQAVVAVWGEFPQGVVEENRVVYLDASDLTGWLETRAPSLTSDRLERLAGSTFLSGRDRSTPRA